MKTTLDLNDELLKAAKQRALDTGNTLRQIVETALAQHLKLHKVASQPIKTVVYGGATNLSGVSGEVIARTSEYSDKMGKDSHDLESTAYWEKRFGFIPPALR
jgi:hypothetical protein